MKRFVKISLLFVSFLALILFGTLVINAYDENLSEASKEALKTLPGKPGYSLGKLKEATNIDAKDDGYRMPVLQKYQDYTKDPAAIDEALKRNSNSLQALLEAQEVGSFEEKPITNFRDGLVFYPFSIQPILLMHVSQLIHQGKEEAALAVLQKSNLLLKSLITSPHTLLQTLMALANIKRNAVFAESLKEESAAVLMSVELRDSFAIPLTSSEIFNNAMTRELQLSTRFMHEPSVMAFQASNINDDTPFQVSNLERLLTKTLFRKNQTINWFTDIHAELRSEPCRAQKDIVCSETYRSEIMNAGVKTYFVNPIGRALIKLFIPRVTDSMKKIEKTVGELQQISSQLPPL